MKPPTQIGRFGRLLGEDGPEQLFKATIECAVGIKAVRPADLERVIVDSTVQSKAIAHPVDRRLLEIARHKVVSAAKRAGIALKQTYAQEGRTLRRKAGGYGLVERGQGQITFAEVNDGRRPGRRSHHDRDAKCYDRFRASCAARSRVRLMSVSGARLKLAAIEKMTDKVGCLRAFSSNPT